MIKLILQFLKKIIHKVQDEELKTVLIERGLMTEKQ